MIWIGATLLLVAVAAPPAQAAGGEAAARELVIAQESGKVRPLAAVLRSIGARYPGHALDAHMTSERGQKVYVIKWLGQNGQVRHVTVDARTGRILDVR